MYAYILTKCMHTIHICVFIHTHTHIYIYETYTCMHAKTNVRTPIHTITGESVHDYIHIQTQTDTYTQR